VRGYVGGRLGFLEKRRAPDVGLGDLMNCFDSLMMGYMQALFRQVGVRRMAFAL